MFHVAFYSFDEIWNQVMAPSQLHIDLRKGIFYPVAAIDEAVVNADGPKYYRGNDREEYQK